MRTVRNLPARRESVVANWALRFAIFTVFFAAAGIVAHRIDLVSTNDFQSLIVATIGATGVTLLLIVLGLAGLWVHGTKGGRRLIAAIVWIAFVAGPVCLASYRYVTAPAATDVSTDLINPPVFRSEIAEYGRSAAAIVAGDLPDSYAAFTGRRYNSPIDTIETAVASVASGQGWRWVRTRGRIGADDVLTMEFERVSLVLALPNDILVRLTDEGDTTFVDVRSRSRYFNHDLGSNASVIQAFLNALDFSLIGVAGR